MTENETEIPVFTNAGQEAGEQLHSNLACVSCIDNPETGAIRACPDFGMVGRSPVSAVMKAFCKGNRAIIFDKDKHSVCKLFLSTISSSTVEQTNSREPAAWQLCAECEAFQQ